MGMSGQRVRVRVYVCVCVCVSVRVCVCVWVGERGERALTPSAHRLFNDYYY